MKSLLTGLSVLAAANMAFAATTTTTDAGQTTAKVEEVKEEKSKFSVSLFQETYIGAADANAGEFDSAVADTFIGLGYKLNDTQSATIRQNFSMNQTDAEKTAEYDIGDVTLIFKDKAAYKLGNEPVAQQFRLYLPVNENSRENGTVQARWGVAVDQTISPALTVSYANTVRGYFHSKESGQDASRNYTSATATYKVNDIVSPYMELGHVARFRHTGEGVRGLDADKAASNPQNFASNAYLDLGVNISAGPVGITLYVDQDHDLTGGKDFVLGDEDQLTYSMILSTSL